ncbi:bifunctional folylpolyglutamate synthase/dihydrofolate synthase [Paraliomyxa miuraensis]|uniref:bifunctional folylpolyglutamate synthase/dihydrofolate synthase n=1 Tax=Paraliomyxa miuraensis TaxID=376150 RepID=UPI00225A616E|nr:cyanophycin synthetase [Paraliomyxa miuraensis]MCX4245583.1 hypothetical protein [Paraliomyxa miuraensis]
MSTEDPIRALLQLPVHGAGLPLHRMLHVVDALEHCAPAWVTALDAIKITGSNGKGSVCTMVAAILGAVGLKVGLYTSPHLLRFGERIVVDGRPIDGAELHQSHAWFQRLREDYLDAHPGDDFGAFEAITAVALHRFARANVDVVVAEAGIGGRYDATRAIPGRTCGLVSVDLEHTTLLGSTAETIAFDKSELCPPGGTLLTGPLPVSLRRRLHAHCRLREVELGGVHERTEARVRTQSLEGTTAWMAVDDLLVPALELPVPGEHQLDNAALAIALARHWLSRHRPELASAALGAAIPRALAGLKLPGRLEVVAHEPTVIVDVGHTPAATAAVARTLEPLVGTRAAILVVGISEDREPDAIVEPLLALASEVIVTRAHHRGGEPSRLRPVLERWAQGPWSVVPTIEQAMVLACEHARTQGRPVVVAGGLFLAMEAKATMGGGDPAMILRG